MNENVNFFDFSLTDLIWEEDFRKWVLSPDPQSDNHWNKAIEKAYGIDIIYDEGSFRNRSFTATLNSESMYDKLDIICKALNSRYEVIDGKIVIYNNASIY